ncbi:MAG TPA: cytochrome c family protein [Allosphingosinicella sp.]|jgi:cytochrome c
MDNRFNTIAGWVLGGGIVLLGASLVTGEMFKSERPEKMGYPIAGVVEEAADGAEAEPPIAALLQTADATAGEAVFRKCAACHTVAQGGPNQLGPNLWGVMGEPIGTGHAGYAFSEALRSKGGTWTWEAMNEWLRSPRAFAPGTKMTFAGLGDAEDRANLMAYLNQQGSNLPLPPPPAAAGNPAEAAAAQADAPAQGDMGSEQPQLNATTTPRTEGTVKGPAAPDTSGQAGQQQQH